MSVESSCTTSIAALDLDVSAEEYLEYRIPHADTNVQYSLASNVGGVIFNRGDCPPPCTRRWPPEGASPGAGSQEHSLSMQFFGDESLRYEIDHKSSSGEVIQVVRRCDFRNSGSSAAHHSGLTVTVL